MNAIVPLPATTETSMAEVLAIKAATTVGRNKRFMSDDPLLDVWPAPRGAQVAT